MAAKIASDKKKKKILEKKTICPTCNGTMRPVKMAGYGDKGMYWTCYGTDAAGEGCGVKYRTGN